MKPRAASDILRDHARERWLRRAVRSVNLDGDLGATPRMSESAWVDSCQLVRGVPHELLDVLGVRECEATEATWSKVGIDVAPDKVIEVQTEQLARPLTLVQAGARLGLELGYDELKAMRQAAIATVTENLLRRRAQEGRAA